MGNKLKGEVTFEHEGHTHSLRLKTDSLCKLEALAEGRPATEYISEFMEDTRAGKVSYSKMRLIMWAAKLGQDKDFTLYASADLLDGIGTKKALEVIVALLNVTWGTNETEVSPT